VLENTLSLLSYQKNFRNLETQLNLQPGLPRVLADESQLSQVFLNIMLNAMDAMPDGGAVTIRAGASGNRVSIHIVDTCLRQVAYDAESGSFDIDKAVGKRTHLGYAVLLSVAGMIVGALTP
jgi:signal transduction histidine kinase